MKKRLQLILGGLFFALFFVYAGVAFYRTLMLPANTSNPGWRWERRAGRVVIVVVAPEGPASKLRVGDEIVAVNGQQLRSESQITEAFQLAEPGSGYTIVVRRDGELLEFLLHTEPFPRIWFTLLRAAGVIIPAIFLITGFAVFLVKPFDKQALLLALMFGMFVGALAAGPVSSAGNESAWVVGVAMAVRLVSIFFSPVFFHFFLIFPEPSPILRRFPRLELYLYLPHLLTLFLYSLITDISLLIEPEHARAFSKRFEFILELSVVLTLIYIAAGLASLLVNYRQASLSSRRKMRVVVTGSVAGFLPPLVLIGVSFLLYLFGFNFSRVNQELLQWLVLAVFFAFLLFPLSFAYAIVRHQVIPVRLIIRRGVRYLLVSRGFIIVEAVVVFSLLSFLLTGARAELIDRLGARADIAVTAVATLAAVLLLRTINRRVMPIIDRRFFRESYDAQQILSELGQAVRIATTTEQMLDMVVVKIQDALHPENVTIFLCDEATGDYFCAASSIRGGEAASLILRRNSLVVERLRQWSQPLIVDFQEPRLWPSPRSPGGGAHEPGQRGKEALLRIRSAMLIPIVAKERLLGIISLGPRLADLPFSREDKQMLLAVAWQMAFAIENAKLIRQVADEQWLRHEIEIAAEVQRRLFPERPPEFVQLELSGVCIPARGVGGDYYDFLSLGRGQVGIAVADVAGKGISAALLMSMVQASLRSQVASVDGRLTELVSSMNKLLHRSTGPHSYATFFYAQYDERSGLLTYVNAGHNPPILVRASAALQAPHLVRRSAVAAATDPQVRGPWQEIHPSPRQFESGVATGSGSFSTGRLAELAGSGISLLTTGGTVLGAFSNSSYEQEAVQMQSGDVLVAYTDGVTEALNPEGAEFGEARLLRVAGECARLSASELSEQIVLSVQEWCRDTPQYDDLTLVIMKVK